VTARRVDVGEAGVTVAGGAGVDSVPWAELTAVTIRTTDAGPLEDDMQWRLHRKNGTVLTIGSETPGVEALLERLQRLPGFDNEAVIRASASTENAEFPCWGRRTVTLRDERVGADTRWLGAYLDATGALHVDGHDLGPGTAPVSGDGEYEWFEVIRAVDLPRLVAALGGDPGDDVLDLLARDWTGPRSYDFERRLRESGVPVKIFTWGG
jgi:hypothetical protein